MNLKAKKRPPRRWDWLAAFLFLVILQIAAARLVATRWTEHLALIHVVTFFGTLLGLALGYSLFSRWIAWVFALAYGAYIIPWQLGLTLAKGTAWPERLLSMQGRLRLVLEELATREPVTDNLLFLFLMACIFWVIGVYTSFILVRYGHIWRVILPAGVAAFVIHTFDPLLVSRSWYLAFYLFFALLLVARLVFLKNQAGWKLRNTHTPPDVGFDLARFAALAAMILVLFSWNVPVLAESLKPVAEVWRTASHPWMNFRDRMSFAFSSLRASVGLVSDFYGDNLPLGLGTPLGEQVLMEVEAPRVPPQGVRYYWRARVYTIYTENEWAVGFEDRREFFPSGRDLTQPGVEARTEASFIFFPHDPISILYVPPQPLWVSRQSDLTIVTNPDGTIDLESIQAQDHIRPGERYEVRSSLSAVTIKDLRASGTDYPQWVLDRYLQLPDDISPRIRALAQSLAQGYDNPYDITAAVTDYLRQTIAYQQTIDVPPAGADRLDWFLFDYQRGFCYYYATAEVVMLRSLGIPARMAVGFAQGEQEETPIVIPPTGQDGQPGPDPQVEDTVTYVVRQKDAHAWPEVYFPGIGWVEFEPTGGQDPLFRPSGEELTGDDPLLPDPREDPNLDDPLAGLDDPATDPNSLDASNNSVLEFFTLGRIVQLGILLLAIVLLVLVIWQTRRGRPIAPYLTSFVEQMPVRLERGLRRLGIQPPRFLREWAYTAGLPPLSRAYLEVNRSLHRLGKETRIEDTPAERVGSLVESLPPATAPANSLLHEYQTGIYSPYQADTEVAQSASSLLRKLSYIAIIKRIFSRFQEPADRT